VLSADAVGYSRLMAQDEGATIRTVRDYREQIGVLVRQHRGEVVDNPGDNVLAQFPTALDAVRSALEIQRVIRARNADVSPDRKMEFRIGVHLGDVAFEGGRVYGEGVNLAARLEGVAETGGICVSATVYEQVRNHLDVSFEDVGEQRLKNVAEPVHAFSVRLERPSIEEAARTLQVASRPRGVLAVAAVAAVVGLSAAVWWGWSRVPEFPGPAADGPPSIAVLPFTNMSNDAEQEYFADGITEDLITDLSKVAGLVVIARNSTFTYKGKAVRVDQVGRELGVRYVLEGSVRKAGDRVRVTAQLVEAANGHHVWADRYDRSIEDVFEAQDQLTAQIVAALELSLSAGEQDRVRALPTDNMEAWDAYLRADHEMFIGGLDPLLRARGLAERAVELDPDFGAAWALISGTYMSAWLGQLTDDPETMNRAIETAEEGTRVAPRDARALQQLASVYSFAGRMEASIAAADRAVAQNPNQAQAYLALAQNYMMSSRFEEAEAASDRARRLDPYGLFVDWYAGLVRAWRGRFREAIPHLERAAARQPGFIPPHSTLAWCWIELGDEPAARAEAAKVLEISPGWSVREMENRIPITSPETWERMVEALMRVGLG